MEQAHANDPDLLFVYGTLKRGLTNHGMLQAAPFLEEVWLDGLNLHDLGPFPMAVIGTGRLQGELYRIAPTLLPALDRFEGAPRLYRRQPWPLWDGRWVWIYLGQPRQVRHSPRLPHGIWPRLEELPPASTRPLDRPRPCPLP